MAIQDFREIIVLDPELRFIGSHHFQYDDSIARGANALGVPIRLFSHTDIEPQVTENLPATPAFADLLEFQRRVSRAWPFPSLPQVPGLLLFLLENRWRRRELDRIFRTLDLRDRLVLAPTCGSNLGAAVVRSLGKRLSGRTRVVLVFHQPPDRFTARAALRTLVPMVRAGKVIPAATNERLAEHYQAVLGLPVRTLPWPLQPLPLLPPRPGGSAPGRPVRFLVVGGFRMEKGIDLLVRALEILEPQIADGTMGFLIQGFSNPEVPDLEARRRFETLRALAARQPGVQRLEEAFDPTGLKYRQLYADSDAVLLPYKRAAYRMRDSAVLMEALALGKPVITTEGTCMAMLLEKGGAGLTCADGSVTDLVRAIRELAADPLRYTAEAARLREGWVSFHNPENYLRMAGEFTAGKEAARHPDR